MSTPEPFRCVSLDAPCAICGKGDWCRRTVDGAHECHRIDEATVNGYVRIVRTPAGFGVYRHPVDQPTGAGHETGSGTGGAQPTTNADFGAEDRRFRAALSSERKAEIARQLGVTAAALDAIGTGEANHDDLKRLRASGNRWRENPPLIVTAFPECDATGALVGFCFRTDDGRKGAPAGKVGATRGLIIPATLPTRPDPVLVVEGPTDAAACETLGLASVGRPSNTSGGKFVAQLLARRDVLVVGENDRNPAGSWPGRDGAERLAAYLTHAWKRSVRWALPPEEHKDVRAYLLGLVSEGLDVNDEPACHEAGRRFLQGLMASVSEVQPAESAPTSRPGDDGARDAVLRLTKEAGDHLFHDNEIRGFALVREAGVLRTLPVRSREYGLLLGRRYYRATGSGLPTTAKAEAVATLEGIAAFDGPEEPVFVRIGEHEGKVVLDLCDKDWRVVIIDEHGWKVVNEAPVRFRRSRGMLPLPCPTRGGSIADLRRFLNVQSDADFTLIAAFVIGSLNPHGPFMILLVNGEPGSAKSTLCRLIRALVDPNKAPLRGEPKDLRDAAIAANNAWMFGLDNISHVSLWLSNALCRIATGGGFATRELYTDFDEAIFDAKRPILINGIGDVADRSDLLDRALRLSLNVIPESERRTEGAIWREFEARRPAILGALLDAVSTALRNRDSVRFDRLPRMADCAAWVVAAEESCPWPPGSFVAALDVQRRDADEFVIESDPTAAAVRTYIETRGELQGTAAQVLTLLCGAVDEKQLKLQAWPKSPSALGTKLREVAPNLRRMGIEVTFSRSGAHRGITIRKHAKAPDPPSSPSPPSSSAGDSAWEPGIEGPEDPGSDGV